MNSRLLAVVFWVLTVAFFSWDWVSSAPVDVHAEPPLIAAGSGMAPTGAHCASVF